eukprot:Gb_38247 [translate_table: standard]
MPVLASGNWSREDHSCSICSLPYVLQMHSPRNLFNQNRGKSLRPEFFVNTQKIYLCHQDRSVTDSDFRWNSCDESH